MKENDESGEMKRRVAASKRRCGESKRKGGQK